MLKTLIAGLAVIKKARRAGDALDDDLNKNGVPDYLDLKKEIQDLKPIAKDLVARGKRIIELVSALAAHVMEAM